MITKYVSVLKYLAVFFLFFFAIVSCEKDMEGIGVELIDNDTFSTDRVSSDVITTNENIDRVPTNGLQQYLFGVYSDSEFGKLEASIVTQLQLQRFGDSYYYGTNGMIDSVIVDIPYQSTSIENASDGKPLFELDSVFGNQDTPFQIEIFELKTFLNTLDPEDPSKPAVYYSDKEFQKGDSPLFSGNFKVNPNDTVAYIKRYMPDGITVYKTDTIKDTDLDPSIKIPLNEQMIQQLFVDNAGDAVFDSSDSFIHYFRGLVLEASHLGNPESHLLSLSMIGANMTIYYSKDENELADQDLNDNGTTGEQGVRTSHTYVFPFGTLKANSLKRDYTSSKASGLDKLYVQGAGGSIAVLDLFENDDLIELQNKNWLINDANLTFYVDQGSSSNIAPEQLFLYNYSENEQLQDMLSEGIGAVGGLLERDEDGKPFKYVFKITDFISDVLSFDDPADLVKIGLKVYNPTDIPTSITDTKIRPHNWNPKGVVLYGHSASAGDKKIKLSISYTQLNNQ